MLTPVIRPKPTELPLTRHASSEGGPTRPGVISGAHTDRRPAKRTHQSYSTDATDGEPVEVKRRKRDVVIGCMKRAVVGIANLFRSHNLLSIRSQSPRHHEETKAQSVTLMGIDELHTSWLNNTEWKMSKPGSNMTERGKNPFQSSTTPPLIRKYSGADRERRGSLQLLPSRPAVRGPTTNTDPACNGFGHNRCHKSILAVEEAIKQEDKEHYRRLVEMVTKEYNKSRPLPFYRARPQDELLSQLDAAARRKTGYTGFPDAFKNPPVTKDWTFSEASEDTHPTKRKPVPELDLSAEVTNRLRLHDRDSVRVSSSEATSQSRRSDEDFPGLTKEMAAEVSAALAQRDQSCVQSSAFKLRITQRDLATLQDGRWLNDEVINFYLNLVMERSSRGAAALKVFSFNTFFFSKLRGGGHAAVKRWTKAVDVFSYNVILVPLHLDIHWAMAVIDLSSKTVKSYDSMGQRHDDICHLLLLYLEEEHRVKKGRELDSAAWTVTSLRPSEIPQQTNCIDCGVFACKYADYISKGKPFNFKQCHIPLFRKLMIWEILNQKLL